MDNETLKALLTAGMFFFGILLLGGFAWWLAIIIPGWRLKHQVRQYTSPDEFFPWKPGKVKSITVYFLNAAGELREVPFDKYRRLRFPPTDSPAIWLLKVEGKEKDDAWYHVGSRNKNWERRWKLYPNLIPDQKNTLLARDNHNQSIVIVPPKGRNIYAEALDFVARYICAHHLLIVRLQEFGVPVLKQSKHTMGKSAALGELRTMIVAGADYLRHNHDPDPTKRAEAQT